MGAKKATPNYSGWLFFIFSPVVPGGGTGRHNKVGYGSKTGMPIMGQTTRIKRPVTTMRRTLAMTP